ncbi:unnamed protein product [Chrysodeixis includens]|uniref:Uncharacterized protein n=1 Tax=Chrysodeixis includens TaxID=689277 RepID=A0A9N8Q321_CHRIL|nr:unnamed protein product [Chrysodeixis includens]
MQYELPARSSSRGLARALNMLTACLPDHFMATAGEDRELECPGYGTGNSIDLQLRGARLHTGSRARSNMLAACDHDAILLILLLQRLNTKADIILGQIREK